MYALGGQSDSSESSQSFSAQLMVDAGRRRSCSSSSGSSSPAIGIAFIVRGFTRAFEKHLDLPARGPGRSKGIVTFGVVGYVAKGIAIAVTGVLFVVAAFTHDPETAGGLDAALHTLAGTAVRRRSSSGSSASGSILYGLFCFARARYARM